MPAAKLFSFYRKILFDSNFPMQLNYRNSDTVLITNTHSRNVFPIYKNVHPIARKIIYNISCEGRRRSVIIARIKLFAFFF